MIDTVDPLRDVWWVRCPLDLNTLTEATRRCSCDPASHPEATRLMWEATQGRFQKTSGNTNSLLQWMPLGALHLSAGSRKKNSTGDSGLWQATAQMSYLNMIKLNFSKRLRPGVAPRLPQTPSCWMEFYQKSGHPHASLALHIWLRNVEIWLGLQWSWSEKNHSKRGLCGIANSRKDA